MLSTMIRSGFFPPGRREVNCGSSMITVWTPTMMPVRALRSWCTRSLAAGPVIHCDSPVRVAIFPSRDIAAFMTTKGSFFTMYFMNISFKRLLSSARMPVTTSMPAACSFLTPRPETNGFGSKAAMTTRPIFFSMILSEQGGVLPKWEQGSRVT